MHRLIFCVKLEKEANGLAEPPFPGELGQEIFDHISHEAWELWLDHQTKLINEYRLSLVDPKAKQFLKQEMIKFLFGEGSDNPPGYVEHS